MDYEKRNLKHCFEKQFSINCKQTKRATIEITENSLRNIKNRSHLSQQVIIM